MFNVLDIFEFYFTAKPLLKTNLFYLPFISAENKGQHV